VAAQTRILLVSGSTRGASSNTVALRTIREVAPEGVDTELYDGLPSCPRSVPMTTARSRPRRWPGCAG
jgi:chromate reductase, NAD(P)H dehydrogenase (quinone)